MDDRSARAALIFAAEPADDGGALRATLPLLGASLVEHQVRQALAAGAAHVVVLVATMPQDLLAALDRLRRDGLGVEVARSLADAADRLHPEERVLLIADGCLAEQALVAALAGAPAPALLVCGAGVDSPFERLDAAHRWAGLATIDGALARRTATMPGEWDAESVLLRRAVQANAARIDAGDAVPQLLRTAPVERVPPARLAASRAAGGAWPQRRLFPPIEALALRGLGPRAVPPHWPALAAAALGLLGLPLAAFGLPGAGLAAFLLSGPVMSTARRLARLRLESVRYGRGLERARVAGGALALGAVALAQGDPVWPLAAAVALAAMLAARREAAMLHRQGGTAPRIAADADALAWAALAALPLAGWPGALAAAAGYAALTFALTQDRLSRAV